MKKLAVPLLFLASCVSSNDQKNKVFTEKEFTKLYMDSLHERHPDLVYTIREDLTIDVKVDENTVTHYLNNAYASYIIEPDSFNSTITRYLNAAQDSYKSDEALRRDRIIAVIKDERYIEEITMTMNQNPAAKEPARLVYEKYNNKLVILFGEDEENGISYFTEDMFRESGIKKDSLLPIALRNLDRLLPEIQRNGDKGVYMVTAGGNYEGSLILFKDIWTKENMPVNGEIIMALPTRDLLLITGSKDKEGLVKIRSMAREAWEEGPYQLTPDLFMWTGKKFEPYK